jgi:hypothetical protein
MLSLDLFNTKYERELQEGAVDNLEARRIDDLNMRMLELLDRAKEPAYRKNPGALAGLKAQFQKIKSERDSYFKINPATGMNDSGTLGTTKGKLDEVDPPQRPPAKGLLKNKDLISPQQRVAGATPAKPGISGAVKDIAGGLKRWLQGKPDSGPTYEDQATANPRALGVANFQRLVKANMGKVPTVSLEFIRPEENFKLDQKGLDLISDYYDGLENDQAKNYFIYRVLPSGEETLKVFKQLGWNPQQVQQELPGIPTQGELPLSEKKKFEKDSEVGGDVKVTRELQKLRAQYPTARNDLEAVAQSEIDSTERSQQQLAAIRGANQKQDALLKQLVALDQEQGREIDGLDQENNSLEKRLAQVQSTNDRITSAITQMTRTKKAPARQPTDVEKGGIIDLAPKVVPGADPGVQSEPAPNQQKATAGKSPAIASMAQQIQGLNKPAPGIRPAPGIKSANEPQAQAVAEHGGGIGPRQHWQDLMQERKLSVGDPVVVTAPNEFEGKTGEISEFSPSGKFVVVNLYNHGEHSMHLSDIAYNDYADQEQDEEDDWYDKELNEFAPSPERDDDEVPDQILKLANRWWNATDDQPKITNVLRSLGWSIAQVESEDDAVQMQHDDGTTYFISADDFDPDVFEGWSDAIVAQRTGQPRTPYSVYIKGKKWKDFENDDRAEAVANKLRAKFKAEGRDPGVITIAPTDMSEGVAEVATDYSKRRARERDVDAGKPVKALPKNPQTDYAKKRAKDRKDMELGEGLMKEPTNRKEYLDQRDKLFRMMSLESNPANKQIIKQAIKDLETRFGASTNIREESSTSSDAVERAVLNRIMVAHTDLLMKFGPEKVMQAAEEVAYNVGDIDEIGTSDVSAYVNQVKQILGVTA